MRGLKLAPPHSPTEPVTETFHGTAVTDPFRWLEDGETPRTRQWLEEQARYARAYLDGIPHREYVRRRVCEFLNIELCDSLHVVDDRYFFRKRLRGQEQPCIYMREGADGDDQLLLSPSKTTDDIHSSITLLRVSPNGRLLLYETKEGGERTGTFAVFDIENRRTLPEVLPRGYLRGFAFGPDSASFYYVHEALGAKCPSPSTACHHVLGTPMNDDRQIFCAGEDKVRLRLIADSKQIGFLVHRHRERTYTGFYLKRFESSSSPQPLIEDASYSFGPCLSHERILAITDRDAPNLRIVELDVRGDRDLQWTDIVPESDSRIDEWCVVGDRIFVSYIRQTTPEISIFDFSGRKIGVMPICQTETIHFIGAAEEHRELLYESQSFTDPIGIFRYRVDTRETTLWARRHAPFDASRYDHTQVWYASRDGTRVPMYLMGRREVLASGSHPTIMTSYGGFGVPMTPQFSVFVAFLVERGCLFALPNIRGGSEMGAEWHNAAKRRNRQNAYDDFACAAEWLINTRRTTPESLAIFGGSNSGLLVGVALTQRPELFRAVVCIAPLLDMLRYHHFDGAHVWRDEFGSSDDCDDFAALASYSPYHHVRPGAAYPAVMIIAGDADGNCNPLHARKMAARLQSADSSGHPILLDYGKFRGHSPVLPLSDRIDSLTDRLTFLCDQLKLPMSDEGGSPCHYSS
jgi:prolyl oligopeptidase